MLCRTTPRVGTRILALTVLLGTFAFAWSMAVAFPTFSLKSHSRISWQTIPETSAKDGNQELVNYLKGLFEGEVGKEIEMNYPCNGEDGELVSFRVAHTAEWTKIMMRIIIYVGPRNLEDVVFIHVMLMDNKPPRFMAMANGRSMSEPLPEFVQTEYRLCPTFLL